jgi:hypothetical protein
MVINMRLKPVLMCAASLSLFVLISAVTATASNDRCAFPPDLRDEMSKNIRVQELSVWQI